MAVKKKVSARTSPQPPSASLKRRARRIVELLEKTYPDARIALDASTPLELLIALILAAQCTDERVNQVTSRLFPKYRSAADWAAIPRDELEKLIYETGFFRNKTKAILGCCSLLVERHGGEVPSTLEALVELPGVGRKTANIVLGNAFGQDTIGVDTHVGRLAQRLELTSQTDPDKIEADLVPLVPEGKRVRFCHMLQSHGRRVCLARKPACGVCLLRRVCPYPAKAS